MVIQHYIHVDDTDTSLGTHIEVNHVVGSDNHGYCYELKVNGFSLGIFTESTAYRILRAMMYVTHEQIRTTFIDSDKLP